MDFFSALQIAAYGMRAQSGRMRLIAENLANADSVSPSATGEPYRRRIAAMSSAFDRELNANVVQLDRSDPGPHRVPSAIRSRQSARRYGAAMCACPT